MRKMNPRILVAIIASLIDEVALVVAVVWVLPRLGVEVPVWLVILLAILFLASGVWTLVVVKKRPNLGFENQIGVKALAVTRIRKKGLVRIGRENWAARTEGPEIEPGTNVVVVSQNALILTVVPDDDLKR